jgi:hypothetical protein
MPKHPDSDRLIELLGELLCERLRLREIQRDLARRVHDNSTCSARLDALLAELNHELVPPGPGLSLVKLAQTAKADDAEPS